MMPAKGYSTLIAIDLAGYTMNTISELIKRHESSLEELGRALHLLRKSPLAIVGIAIVSLYFIVLIFAPLIAPYGPEERVWKEPFQPPSKKHIFGTDDTGGDIFSRIIWGTRTTFRIIFAIETLTLLIGIILGCISGYYGGMVDDIIMRVTDAFFCIPGVILAMAMASFLGRSIEMMMLSLSLVSWPFYARFMRGQVLSVKGNQYVEAARSLGASDTRIISGHILPNAAGPLIVSVSLDVGGIALLAAGLSFLGFLHDPGVAEWGRMIAEGQRYAFVHPWMFVYPGLALLLFSLGWNLFGDALRDVLDPRMGR